MIKQATFVVALFMGAAEAKKLHHKPHFYIHTLAQEPKVAYNVPYNYEIMSIAGPETTSHFGSSVHEMVMNTPGVSEIP